MTTQDGPKTAQDRPRHPQDTPKTAQDPSKTTLLYLTAGGSFPTVSPAPHRRPWRKLRPREPTRPGQFNILIFAAVLYKKRAVRPTENILKRPMGDIGARGAGGILYWGLLVSPSPPAGLGGTTPIFPSPPLFHTPTQFNFTSTSLLKIIST